MTKKEYTKMTERESILALCDGMRQSASAAREMAEITENPDWLNTATMLDNLQSTGYKLARMKDMNRGERLAALDLKVSSVNRNPLSGR